MPGLNAIRAIAILLVIFYHLGFPSSGLLGVNAFFVLSGFLITTILLREAAKTGDISFSNFYRRRAYRIFPTFYVCWTLTILVLLAKHQHVRPWEALSSFTYTADYGRAFLSEKRQEIFPLGSSWSLAVEEQYYLLWPLLLLYLLKTPDKLVRRLGTIIVGLWTYRAILILGFKVSWLYAYNAFDTRVDSIMVGSFLAVVLARPGRPKWLLWWLRSKWLALIPVALLTLCAASERLDGQHDGLTLLIYTLQPIILLILLTQWIYWGHFSWTIMRSAIVAYVAHISYALYLYHPIILTLQPKLPIIKQRATEFIVMFLVATASFYLLEKPLMNLRDRREKKHRHPAGEETRMLAR